MGGGADWQLAPLSAASVVFPDADSLSKPRYGVIIPMAEDALKQYASRARSLYIETRIVYKDIFGRPHSTTACVFHFSANDPASFSRCESGNNAD